MASDGCRDLRETSEYRHRARRDEEYAAARWLALLRTAVSLGCHQQEAEDLAQATLVQCYVKWPKVRDAADRDAYVAKILLNLHRAAHRRGKATREVTMAFLPEVSTNDASDRVAAADALRRAVADLSQGQREVLALTFFVRLPQGQVAEVLGIAPGTVKSRLSRALAILARSPHLAPIDERNP